MIIQSKIHRVRCRPVIGLAAVSLRSLEPRVMRKLKKKKSSDRDTLYLEKVNLAGWNTNLPSYQTESETFDSTLQQKKTYFM